MPNLFCIATNRFKLSWERVRQHDPPVLARSLPVMGRLHLLNVAPGLTLTPETTRAGMRDQFAVDLDFTAGPPLYEQTDYRLFARTVDPMDKIEIRHRDPLIEQSLSIQDEGQITHGVINFRNQVGRSLFSVWVNGQRQLDFEVEVFPTKVDYESDYEEILADVQSILTSLAYEYLRSTYQLGKASPGAKPSRL
ncbi:MAG: hypothetical protein RLZZ396_2723, partial [Planctomycetota bacterium]